MGRDEQIERLMDAVRVLLEDNDNLRQLLAGLGGYIVSLFALLPSFFVY